MKFGKHAIDFFAAHGWLLHICITIIVMLVATWVSSFIFRRFKSRGGVWQRALIDALDKPFYYYIWLYGTCLIFQEALSAIVQEATWTIGFGKSRNLITVLMLMWFVWRFIAGIESKLILERRWETQQGLDQTSIHALGQVSRIVLFIISILLALQAGGVSISALLAFGGVGALAFSLAAKDTLANVIGGLMIFWDRPFSVGDWVRSPDKEIEGTVEHVGWRLTTIRTFDMRCLYVPNALFSTISLENPSRMTNRRIKQIVGLRYDDGAKVRHVLRDVEAMLKEHPDIDTRQTLMVNLIEFASSSLDFMIYTFTKTTNWVEYQSIQQDVLLKVLDIIEQNGAQCAFPTMTIDAPEGQQKLLD